MGLGRHASRAAHVFKALAKQHHRELLPLLRRLIPCDGVVIDVGAHAGQFCKLFAGLAPEGRVLAVEPQAYARSILMHVVRWHRLRNVTIVTEALSNRVGTAELAVPQKRGGRTAFGLAHLGPESTRPARHETVMLTTLDALVEAHGLTRLDFVKADIEGWEIPMLRGGTASIRRFRPTLLLELNEAHAARAGGTPAEVWRLLAPLGYVARQVNGGAAGVPVSGFVGAADYLFTARGTTLN